jgi:hypothetical protein
MSIEDDPTSMAGFGFVGTFEYDEGTTMIDAPGEFPDPAPLELKAVVYFPADAPGATGPAQISRGRVSDGGRGPRQQQFPAELPGLRLSA